MASVKEQMAKAKSLWAETPWEEIATFIGPNAEYYRAHYEKIHASMAERGSPGFMFTRVRPVDPSTALSFPQLAPEHMGAYSKSAVRWLEGRYLALRPSFSTPGDIFSYLIDIHWVEEAGYLTFAERKQVDTRIEQTGHVSLPNLSGHIYLATNESGQLRLMMLSRPTVEGTLYGTLSALREGQGSQLAPACCAIALVRFERLDDPLIGAVPNGTPHHTAYSKILIAVTALEFASFF